MKRSVVTVMAAILLTLPGCLDLPKVTNGVAGAGGAGGESLPQAYGYYGTGHPLDRPNQIRQVVVFGKQSGGEPCWKH